jgi:solute carrier family 25 iron transporter 28/37
MWILSSSFVSLFETCHQFQGCNTHFGEQGVCGCERFSSSSIGDVFKTIIKRDGYSGLMRGWKPRMLFHAPAAAICWSTYEASKSFFERFNEERRK